MGDTASFWDHLDALRSTLLRMLAVALLMAVAVFCMKEWIFRLVLWPLHPDFPTYALLSGSPPSISLINTALTEQFMVHMKVSIMVGALAASPYLLYALFKFVSPALYDGELSGLCGLHHRTGGQLHADFSAHCALPRDI